MSPVLRRNRSQGMFFLEALQQTPLRMEGSLRKQASSQSLLSTSASVPLSGVVSEEEAQSQEKDEIMINQPEPQMAAATQSREIVNPGAEDSIVTSDATRVSHEEVLQTYNVESADNQLVPLGTKLDREKRRAWVSNSVSFLVWRAAHGSGTAFLLPSPGGRPKATFAALSVALQPEACRSLFRHLS